MLEPYSSPSTVRLSCRHVPPARSVPTLLDDVRDGLLTPPRQLPPKYFYDARGSALFDRLCETREYYPTRVEDALLARWANDILGRTMPAHILELGSGSSRKTRRLLAAAEAQALRPAYWPFDVCEPMLLETGARLIEDHPWLQVNALVGDYHGGLDHLPALDGTVLWVFLGGTLGNFEPRQALDLLRELRWKMGPSDRLLLGVDRVKDAAVLTAAYNDAAGITAEFNRNVLHVINRELGADFDVGSFIHEAIYRPDREQVEMYLYARKPQQVNLPPLGTVLTLAPGERILTEISRKFTPESLDCLLAQGGFAVDAHYQPGDGGFSLLVAAPDHRG